MNILGYIFAVLAVTTGLLLASGHAKVNCYEPYWFDKSYYCKATLYIPR